MKKYQVTYAEKPKCIQCGRCCKDEVCTLGIAYLATTDTPCPALSYSDEKYWCGLVTEPAKHLFRNLNFTTSQYEGIKRHILKVNNFGEGCDMEIWKPIGDRE